MAAETTYWQRMTVLTETSPRLRLAGAYHREVAGAIGRIWENVFDWEHLPALHAADFRAVELLDRGRWGWRVRLVNQPGGEARTQVLELRADRTAGAYCATTLSGPGAGTEIRTSLKPLARFRTEVTVEFHVPEHRPERLARIGERYLEIYQRLWDQDEAMIVERERAIRARRRRRSPARPRSLGAIASVRARLPLVVSFGGERFRIVDLDGDLVAHAAVCPHWLGPLDGTPVIEGCIRCPWHGYAFEVRTGRSADGRGLTLAPAPQVVVRDGKVLLTR